MDKYKAYKKLNNEFFSQLVTRHGDPDQAIGNSAVSHGKRFQKLLELGDFNGKSILDIGCGTGAFYKFLSAHSHDFSYSGYDINEEMVKKARELNPGIAGQIHMLDILEGKVTESFDFCVSVGPLNLPMDERINYEMTFHLLDMMYKHSKTGFAFSMTSSLSRKQNKETFYYDPKKIMEHLSSFCNNFRIDHSYLPHDFMVFGYKNDFYSK